MTRHFSKATKRLAWDRAKLHCETCTAPLCGGFQYDHRVPWVLSRDSSLDNCQVLCESCHLVKTAFSDIPMIAKAARQSDFHTGISGPGRGNRPLPGGRMSVTRKTIKGRVIKRWSQSQMHRDAMARRYGVFE